MKRGFDLLLDTHVVIWMATAPERLPASWLPIIELARTRFVSHVSAWEIQTKYDKHAARFGFSLDQLEATMKSFSCTELPVEYRDIRELDKMQFIHPDPFDRLLMAQAALRSLRLATLDKNIIRTFESEHSFLLLPVRADA